MDRYAYQMYEMLHLAFAPARAMSEATVHMLNSPLHPFGDNSSRAASPPPPNCSNG